MAASNGRTDERLLAECPRECRTLWDTYLQIAHTRQQGMAACGIQFSEIEAWQRLYQVTLTAWEIDALIIIDRIALSAGQKNTK